MSKHRVYYQEGRERPILDPRFKHDGYKEPHDYKGSPVGSRGTRTYGSDTRIRHPYSGESAAGATLMGEEAAARRQGKSMHELWREKYPMVPRAGEMAVEAAVAEGNETAQAAGHLLLVHSAEPVSEPLSQEVAQTPVVAVQ